MSTYGQTITLRREQTGTELADGYFGYHVLDRWGYCASAFYEDVNDPLLVFEFRIQTVIDEIWDRVQSRIMEITIPD